MLSLVASADPGCGKFRPCKQFNPKEEIMIGTEIPTRSQCLVLLAIFSVLLLAAGSATAQTAQVNTSDSGQQVSVDPQTRKLRAPTAEESKKLSEGMNFNRVPEAVTITRLPNGATMGELPEEYMDATVVTKAPDGTLQMQCVRGLNQANALVNAPASQPVAKAQSKPQAQVGQKSPQKAVAAAKGKE
jgi:hypothetical protein